MCENHKPSQPGSKRSKRLQKGEHAPEVENIKSQSSGLNRSERPTKAKRSAKTSESDSEYSPDPHAVAQQSKQCACRSKHTQQEDRTSSERRRPATHPVVELDEGEPSAKQVEPRTCIVAACVSNLRISSPTPVAEVNISQVLTPPRRGSGRTSAAFPRAQGASGVSHGTSNAAATTDPGLWHSQPLEPLTVSKANPGANKHTSTTSDECASVPTTKKSKVSLVSVLVGPKKQPPLKVPYTAAMPPIHVLQRSSIDPLACDGLHLSFRISEGGMHHACRLAGTSPRGPPLQELLHHSQLLDARCQYLQHASAIAPLTATASTNGGPIKDMRNTSTLLSATSNVNCMDSREQSLKHSKSLETQVIEGSTVGSPALSTSRKSRGGVACLAESSFSPRDQGVAAVQTDLPRTCEAQAWVQKYSPARAENVCGNADVASRILAWLHSFHQDASKEGFHCQRLYVLPSRWHVAVKQMFWEPVASL
jgi:hypothetical protein